MEREAIRQHLADFRRELTECERQESYLRNIVSSLEGLLGSDTVLEPRPSRASALSVPRESTPRAFDFSIKGTLSIQDAVLRVLKSAPGEVLLVPEILRRAEVLGARSNASNRISVINSACITWKKRGEPLEFLGNRAWRWNGTPEPMMPETVPASAHAEEWLQELMAPTGSTENNHA